MTGGSIRSKDWEEEPLNSVWCQGIKSGPGALRQEKRRKATKVGGRNQEGERKCAQQGAVGCQPQTQTSHWDWGQWGWARWWERDRESLLYSRPYACLGRERKRRQGEHKMTLRPAMVNDLDFYTKVKSEVWGHETWASREKMRR